jgi:hypothetical protein
MPPRKETEDAKEPEVEVLEHEEVPDKNMVAESMAWIRQTLELTLNKGVTEIGDHVLEKFFGGDPERVRSRNPRKNASFRLLSDHCSTADLPISRSFLQRAVGVAVMRKLLPEAAVAYKQLPPSHQATLLPLREPDKVEKLAARATSKKMSVRELKEKVDEELAKVEKEPSGRGRRPNPKIVKTLTHTARLFAFDEGKRSFTKAEVAELSDDQKKEALKTAKRLAASLEKLIEQLGGE